MNNSRFVPFKDVPVGSCFTVRAEHVQKHELAMKITGRDSNNRLSVILKPTGRITTVERGDSSRIYRKVDDHLSVAENGADAIFLDSDLMEVVY